MPGKYISEEIKKLIVEAKQKGETDQEVADRFHVNQSTVSKIFKRWRDAKTVKHKKISGRPRKTTSPQNRLHVRLVKADPFKTAVDVWTHTHENMGLDISIRTTRRILIRAGLKGIKAVIKAKPYENFFDHYLFV